MTPLRSLLQRYRAWRLYRETYEALASLDARTRADIGIARFNLESVARHAALKAAA